MISANTWPVLIALGYEFNTSNDSGDSDRILGRRIQQHRRSNKVIMDRKERLQHATKEYDVISDDEEMYDDDEETYDIEPTTLVSAPVEPFRLMDLPSELRCHI